MKITPDLIPQAYYIAKKVYEKEITLKDGGRLLAGANRMNENTARDFINNFRYLRQGKRFSRRLNTESMTYYFEQFLIDYSLAELEKPLTALIRHIEYYESVQKGAMHEMRAIHLKYSDLLRGPVLINNINQLLQNIDTLETCLAEGNDGERLESLNLIKRGTCFIAYKFQKEIRFAPSRFLGYANNQLFKYSKEDVDGRDTNKAISSILKVKPFPSKKYETEYIEYCAKLDITPHPKGTYGVTRKFWGLNLESDFRGNIEITGEFPEGKIVERIHKARERNSQVVELAKELFREKHGRLYCQVCDFDYETKYGEIGKDFIECHHTKPISEMPPDYKTKPEEIAMLCGNCHRMAHRKRPWLTLDQLRNLLIKD